MTRYRLAILSRLIAALGGGYVLISLAVALLARWPQQERAGAVLAATMAGFATYPLLVLAAFHTRTAGRAWCWIITLSLMLALLLMLMPGQPPALDGR